MEDNISRIIKSSVGQAEAAWVTKLNQIRLDNLVEALNRQDINLEEALGELQKLKDFIGDPSHILGSSITKHGEIAEHVQVNVSNARRLIVGLDRNHTFEGVGRTAPEDYLRNGNPIQSKFYNGAKNTLTAIEEHLDGYPDFVNKGGAYDIPKDQYDEIMRVIKLSKSNPSALSKADMRLLKAIEQFEAKTGLSFTKDVNPSVAGYKDVQQGKINKTIDNEEKNIKNEDKKQREEAYNKSKPTLKEGIKVTAVSAAVEGGVGFCMAVAKKVKDGKKISDFTAEDWKEVGIDTGASTLKGGIRGGVMYAATNFTATPSNVASAYVTAVFGITSQINLYKAGNVSKDDFVINCEAICLDVSVSAVASLAGQVFIPIPVLGAVIGNVAGEAVYEICKRYGDSSTQKIVDNYHAEMEELKLKLNEKYKAFMLDLLKAFNRFKDLEELAFDEDVNKAFEGSYRLALEVGVRSDKILTSKNDIDKYFME